MSGGLCTTLKRVKRMIASGTDPTIKDLRFEEKRAG